MGIRDIVQKWVLGQAIRKGAVSLAKFIVSYCMSHAIVFSGAVAGIPIDLQSVVVMTAAINSGIKVLFDLLKTHWPEKFAWL